jgi:group I intron endonuclease
MWNNIVAKSSYDIEILFENLTWEQACLKEKEFIAIYGRKDKLSGCLCNMTDGGDGVVGQIHSEETKVKRGLAIRGENHGMYGKTHTDALKAKWSEERSREKHVLAKKVINTETNEVFNCVKDAAEFYSINYSTLCSWLNKSRPNKGNFIYI